MKRRLNAGEIAILSGMALGFTVLGLVWADGALAAAAGIPSLALGAFLMLSSKPRRTAACARRVDRGTPGPS